MIKSLFKPRTLYGFQANLRTISISKNLNYFGFRKFSVLQENEDASKILEEVEAKVFQVIKERMTKNTDKIERNATFKDLGFDSLDTVDLIVTMEENLRVDIQDEEAARIETVNDSIAILHKYKLEKFNRNKLAEQEEETKLAVKESNKERNDLTKCEQQPYHWEEYILKFMLILATQ